MNSLFARIGLVVAVTALSVLLIPVGDHGVELLFQLVVLVASS